MDYIISQLTARVNVLRALNFVSGLGNNQSLGPQRLCGVHQMLPYGIYDFLIPMAKPQLETTAH